MNTPIRISNRPVRRLIPTVMMVSLILIVSAACNPASPPSGEQATTGVVDSQANPTSTAASPTHTAEIPAGWSTYSSQLCGYEISYPPEMQVTSQSPNSLTLGYQPGQPDDPVPYFVYLSVIDPEITRRVAEGVYDFEVYNYNPAEAEILLEMQVGERTEAAAGFTYQRLPDTMISGYAAQTYENQQPWGFPGGTVERRYLLPVGECTYLMGAYVDSGQSNLPGAFGQDLFQQIAATLRVEP